jgi:transposase
MLKVDQVHAIRHQVLVQGRSSRVVALELGVSRNTVRRYLKRPEPVRVEREARPRPTWEAVRPRLEQLLEEWSTRTTAKQRITGTRIVRQLREEGFVVGTTLIRDYLRERRRAAMEAHVPLVHRPGDDTLVDFFEVYADIEGERRKGAMFLVRPMHSGKDFAILYERQDQVSFLDGHVRAFEHFGAVPQRCVYDNLSAAVTKIVMPHRVLTDRFRALVNHYAFEPCFARPGEGHDKGGVESRGRGIRLQHLTPIPIGTSWAAISRDLQARLDADAMHRRDAQGRTSVERFAEDLAAMRPLPPTRFEARKIVPVSIPRNTRVRVEGAWYSLPSTWKFLDATAFVAPDEVTFTCRGQSTVKPRKAFGESLIDYRDYVPELRKKPQAVRQVAPELLADLGEPYGRLWELLVQAHGAAEAASVLARFLGAIHEHGEEPVRQAVLASMQAGRLDLLALGALMTPRRLECVPVPPTLAHHEVEVARAADYDFLLGDRA